MQGLRDIAALPMSQWATALAGMKGSELSELDSAATAEAVRLCRLAEYAGYRGGFGCGDHGHEAAVKAQNRKAAKVRRAIGYTVAKDDISFGELGAVSLPLLAFQACIALGLASGVAAVVKWAQGVIGGVL